jgi:hypothetical protein
MSERFTTKDGMLVTPLEYEPFEGTLELQCRACGKKGKYSVGRVFINPSKIKKVMDKEIPYEETVFFSGYFHCKKCGSGGPWELPEFTQTRLTLLQVMEMDKPGQFGIQFGEMRLFDGTPSHSGAEGEAHLRKLIEADPRNYYLWSRLGNLFMTGEIPNLAFEAFQKAIQLNPLDVESHHSLAEIHKARDECDQAAEHYHQVLLHAREAPLRTKEKPALLKKMICHTLESLLDLRKETNGRVELYPNPPAQGPGNQNKEAVVVFKNFDLSKEEDWEAWAQTFLGEMPIPSPVGNRLKKKLPPSYRYAEARESHVGRNAPCPCGSGKKFKKCCGGRENPNSTGLL